MESSYLSVIIMPSHINLSNTLSWKDGSKQTYVLDSLPHAWKSWRKSSARKLLLHTIAELRDCESDMEGLEEELNSKYEYPLSEDEEGGFSCSPITQEFISEHLNCIDDTIFPMDDGDLLCCEDVSFEHLWDDKYLEDFEPGKKFNPICID